MDSAIFIVEKCDHGNHICVHDTKLSPWQYTGSSEVPDSNLLSVLAWQPLCHWYTCKHLQSKIVPQDVCTNFGAYNIGLAFWTMPGVYYISEAKKSPKPST